MTVPVKLHAIMVSVDYTDILRLTLPWNRKHFTTVTIVTSKDDARNVRPLCDEHDCSMFVTDSFYANGARFNKWLALEEGIASSPYWKHPVNELVEPRWLCIMDADVCWPSHAVDILARILRPGYLYSPLRRMCPTIGPDVPPEDEWRQFPVHRNVGEWAGYTQIFRSDDPVLGPIPWHQTNWKHAGGADSFFQGRWPSERKVRPGFDVLHLGEAGENWYGRTTEYADGGSPDAFSVARRRTETMRMWRERRERRAKGLDPYSNEKID